MTEAPLPAAPPPSAPGPAGPCPSCGSPHLRRSKTREDDRYWMLLLLWPVRCMSCLKRDRVFFWRALRAMPMAVAHSGQFAAKGHWQELDSRGMQEATGAAPAQKERDAG